MTKHQSQGHVVDQAERERVSGAGVLDHSGLSGLDDGDSGNMYAMACPYCRKHLRLACVREPADGDPHQIISCYHCDGPMKLSWALKYQARYGR